MTATNRRDTCQPLPLYPEPRENQHSDDKSTFPSESEPSTGTRPSDTAHAGRKPVRVQTRLLKRQTSETCPVGIRAEQPETDAEPSVSRPTAVVVVVDGPGSGRTFRIADGLLRIGRGDGQDFQLADDDTVSRTNHAVIGFIPDCQSFAIFDGGKVNPVWVNGIMLKDISFLSSGDVIQIGKTSLRIDIS